MRPALHYQELGLDQGIPVVWAHGWARTGRDWYNVADAVSTRYRHALLDLPGHGQTPRPDEAWDTAAYADEAARWIKQTYEGPVYWVGHSFGCRVGTRLAAQHPELVKGLVLVAAAGLKRERKGLEALRYAYRSNSYKVLKAVLPEGYRDSLRHRYSSADYLNAGEMRDIFIATIAEDQTHVLPQIQCPVSLIFGGLDTETPVELGERMQDLIPNASLKVLDTMNHWDILTRGAAQITQSLVTMIDSQEAA